MKALAQMGLSAVTFSRAETGGFSAKKTGDGQRMKLDPYSGDQLVVSFDHNLNENLEFKFDKLKLFFNFKI